jgi:hypothetical protein
VTIELPEGFPKALWNRVETFVDGGGQGESQELVDELIAWAENRHPDDLEGLLDALRTRGAYPVSLALLEAAWNSDLSPARMGRVVEDWIGTVKFGLNDPKGAEVVASHIVKDVHRHGAAFMGDLGHLLLGWEMYDLAAPLVEEAARAMPGDLSCQFNLGIIQKLRGEWAACRASFQTVLGLRSDDQASRWNLGIACTALGDWTGARAAWTDLGMQLPPGEGDFGEEGETTALRLPFTDGHGDSRYEVVWGRRMGPARARLRTLPRFSKLAGYGDTVLVDGVTVGDTQLDGDTVPVFPVLACLTATRAEVVAFRQTGLSPASRGTVEALVERLNAEGWPTANWSNMVAGEGVSVAIAIPAHQNGSTAVDRTLALSHELALDLELVPQPPVRP